MNRHDEIAVEGIVKPGAMNALPRVKRAPTIDIYENFRKVKNHLFNEYSLLDKCRFFDVIAQSNPRYWQAIGEQCPTAGLPDNVTAQVTLERLYKEPSIVKFIELIQELKNHIRYTSNLPVMRNSGAAEADIHDEIVFELMAALSKFNLDCLALLGDDMDISSNFIESEQIKNASKDLSVNFNSEILNQYKETALQHQKSKSKWGFTKISTKLKFPVIDVGAELEKKL